MRKFQQRRIPSFDDSGIRKEEMRVDRWIKQAATELGKLGAGNTKPPALLVPSAINPPPISGEFWLLRGRPGGQLGYGGTGSGQSATIASTTHPTKGSVYFGAAQETAYDETNERLGVAQPVPLARLHVKVSNPAQLLAPVAVVSHSGAVLWTDNAGSSVAADLIAAVNESSQPSTGDTTFIKHSKQLGTLVFRFGPASGTVTDPLVSTGHVLRIMVRTNDANPGTDYVLVNVGDTSSFTGDRAVPGFTAYPTLGGDLSTTFTLYEYTLTGTEADLITDYNDIRIALLFPIGFSPTETIAIAWIQFEVPSGSGGPAETLQKWENDTFTDTLDFVGDGGSSLDLRLTGTGALRVGLGGGTSGVRLLNSSTSGRIEAGSSAAANMNLVLSGTRATQGTLLTLDFVNALLKGALQFEDPGAGTSTIGITAPASPTTHVLTLPAAIVDLGFLQVVTGGALSWVPLSAASFPHKILESTVHTDTLTADVVAGDIITGNATPKWARLAGVATGNVLLSGGVGAVVAWGKVDLTVHVTGDLPYANLAQGSARSVLGVAGNATADVASIQGTTAHDFLKVNSAGTGIGFEPLSAAMLPAHDHSSSSQGGDTLLLRDTGVTFFKASDPTAKFRFECATIAGNTSVFTFPPPLGSGTVTIAVAEQNNTWTGGNDFLSAAVAVNDTFFYIANFTDPSKAVKFLCSGITPATIRVLTVPNANGTIALTSDANGSIDVARTWATLQTFKDTTFKVVDDGDASKTAVFSLGGATANADLILAWAGTVDRTLTLPDATDTLVGKATTDTLSNKTLDDTTVMTIKDANLIVEDDTTTSKKFVIQVSGNAANRTTTLAMSTATNDKTLTLPNITATLAHTGSLAQSFAGNLTMNGVFNATGGGTFSGNTSVAYELNGGINILDYGSSSGPYLFATPGAANFPNFYLPDLPDNSTFIMKTGTDANATSGAGAAIGTTNFSAAPNAGLYAILWDLYVTTAGTSGTVTVTFSWTDDIGATSWTSNTLALGPATGRYPVGTNQPIVFRRASGAISYNTTVAAVVGSPVHKVYARLVAL